MAEKVQKIIEIIDQLAPPKLATEWDNVGLLVGDYSAEVKKVMVSLDVTEAVLDQAIDQEVDLIISHHPLIFKELKTIRTDQTVGRLVIKAIRQGINIFAAHTNLDIAKGGVNDLLAEKLGLTSLEPLKITSNDQLFKLVVYIPAGHEEELRQALSERGAGWIGNYSHCTFQTTGTGTFKPHLGTAPYIGRQDSLEKVKEVRLETIVPASRLGKVIEGMLKEHPYEEVAYDLYPLINRGEEFGLGRIGYLPETVTYQEYLSQIKQVLNLHYLRYVGDLQRQIRKVAICGGSGSSYISTAAAKGADLYITGDVDFHSAQLAESVDLALIDAGHYWTEVLIVPHLVNILEAFFNRESMLVEIVQSKVKTDSLSLYK